MEKQEYISRDDYVERETAGLAYPMKDRCQTRWYDEVIRNSVENKLRLIAEDSEFAYKMFARYEDVEGFELIREFPRLEDSVKRNAQMQLESLLSSKKSKDYSRQISDVGPLVKVFFPFREDVKRAGRSQVETDIAYEGLPIY